ncbi:MAG TPA: phytanoyl-CoA dioxygenase [Gammaproteobacteria bacterium]|jgi:hypothetical protein|nr:phytanoyl-CoA dioxygenase [Gammaproteobacteria bacterium]
MKKLAMWPLWLLQLVTQTKSFARNPILGSVLLNRLGLHVIRLMVAHSIMRLRMVLLSRAIHPLHRKAYYRDGFILVPNFLDDDTFQALLAEVGEMDGQVRECVQGDTLTHRIALDPAQLAGLPTCQAVLEQPGFDRLHRFAAGKNQRPVSYIQTIKNHFTDGAADPQKTLHSDTFHPTMKSWFFLDAVDERNGPFTYVPGSHRLSLARLRWEYRKSIAVSQGGDPYSRNGSLRATLADLEAMQLPAPCALKVPSNTLVIANTHGFHCRGQATETSTRTELWSISRSNPFNPLPGIDHPRLHAMRYALLERWREHCDRRADARGAKASWHVIDARNTLSTKNTRLVDER